MAQFIKNLFTPKWQHSDEKVRNEAINSDMPVDVLLKICQEDIAEKNIIKALSLINDAKAIEPLLDHKNTQVKAFAFKQFCQVVLNQTDLNEQVNTINALADQALFIKLASQSFIPEIAQAAISKIQDENTLFNLIETAESAKSRQLAIANIQNKDLLITIEKRFKNKDKNLVRAAKDKLKAIADEELAQKQSKENIEQILKQIESLKFQAFHPEYVGKFTHLANQWQLAMDEAVNPSHEQESVFQQASITCQQVIKQNQKAIEDSQKLAAEQQSAQEQRQQVNEQLQALYKACKGGAHLQPDFSSSFHETIKNLQTTWAEATKSFKSDTGSQAEYQQFLTPLLNMQSSLDGLENFAKKAIKADEKSSIKQLKNTKKQLTQALKSINWPSEFSIPKLVMEWESTLATVDKLLSNISGQQSNIRATIETSLADLQQAIEQGHLKDAKSLQSALRKNINKLDEKNSPLLGEFQNLNNQLDELNDWQGFAALPKFEELCLRMESLAAEECMDAKQRIQDIKDLQQQWKELGSLSDKNQHNLLWQKFKSSADQAYEPCQAFYDDQHQKRQFNQEQREQICDQLERFYKEYDWANSDWKAIQQLLDKAHHEYKQFSPVERNVHKTLHQRFLDAVNAVHQKLKAFYQGNISDKQALIEKAKALLEEEDLALSTEECKRYQQQWKTFGNAGREEHKLWAEFRNVCDAIFERRSTAYQAQKQQTNALFEQAEGIIEKAQLLTKQEASTGLVALELLKQELEQLDLPLKGKKQKLAKLSNIENELIKQQAKAKKQSQLALWNNGLLLAQTLAEADSNFETDSEERSKSYKTAIGEMDLAKPLYQAFEERLNQTEKHTQDENPWQALCLELEISFGLETPEQDKPLRMSKQVALLQANMGKTMGSKQEQAQNLIKRWCQLATIKSEHSTFEPRFHEGIKQVLK